MGARGVGSHSFAGKFVKKLASFGPDCDFLAHLPLITGFPDRLDLTHIGTMTLADARFA
jgi:hypothetical protein